MGRPTLYKAEMDKKVADYYTEKLKKRELPIVEEVALLLDVDIDTLESWVNGKTLVASDEFIGTIKKIKTLQKIILMTTGLGGNVNTAMAIFLLKANHNMKDIIRSELTGKDGAPLMGAVASSPEQIKSLLDAIEKIASNSNEQNAVSEGASS